MVQRRLPLLGNHTRALVVNLSSTLALIPSPTSPVYYATKVGIRSFNRLCKNPGRRVESASLRGRRTESGPGRGRGIKNLAPAAVVSSPSVPVEQGLDFIPRLPKTYRIGNQSFTSKTQSSSETSRVTLLELQGTALAELLLG
jgi:hypothetical protein